MEFDELLKQFTSRVEKGDSAGLAGLFTEDGTYNDGFYGAFTGRPAIAKMLDKHFHGAAADFRWRMIDPVCDGSRGYARYIFTYVSKIPGAEGRRVVFEGMSCFELRDGQIQSYREIFDRGTALSQLGFAPERIAKSLARWSNELCQSDAGLEIAG